MSFNGALGRYCSPSHKARRSKSGKGLRSCRSQDSLTLLCKPVNITQLLGLGGKSFHGVLTVPTESTASDLDIFLENEAQLAYSKEQARAGRGGGMNAGIKGFLF